MKILIAYDGSSCAAAALDDLRLAGLPSEATAVILSVADVWVAPSPDGDLLPQEAGTAMEERIIAARHQAHEKAMQAVEEARALAIRACNRVQTDFPGWEVSAEASADSPAWAVLKKANTWKPDLIVLGSRGRSTFERVMLGSVSQKVVTEAQCPVRVSRAQDKQAGTPVRLVIGVDGSPGADAAVRTVAHRSWPPNTTASIVAVVDPVLAAAVMWRGEHGKKQTADAQERVQAMVEAAVEKLRDAGLTASAYLLTGNPKQALLEAAERWEADCIFVGARGLRGIGGFLLGSVSTAVSTRAHCSVEVVHTDNEGA
jgi:nucleotide-binding universal stress UspA family protein